MKRVDWALTFGRRSRGVKSVYAYSVLFYCTVYSVQLS